MSDRDKGKRGPKPETVKIEGNWEDAVNKALKKERPEGGWPKDDQESHSEPDSEQVDRD